MIVSVRRRAMKNKCVAPVTKTHLFFIALLLTDTIIRINNTRYAGSYCSDQLVADRASGLGDLVDRRPTCPPQYHLTTNPYIRQVSNIYGEHIHRDTTHQTCALSVDSHGCP